MNHPTDRTAHTTASVIPIVEHWIEWEIAQESTIKYWSYDTSHYEWMLYHALTARCILYGTSSGTEHGLAHTLLLHCVGLQFCTANSTAASINHPSKNNKYFLFNNKLNIFFITIIHSQLYLFIKYRCVLADYVNKLWSFIEIQKGQNHA